MDLIPCREKTRIVRLPGAGMGLTVPGGMGGKEAIERLRELDPEAIAIVSSGYSTDPVMSEHGAYGFRAVLGKPYKPE